MPVDRVMMYIELQEGKTRMMRLHFADEYSATVAATLRLIAAMGLGEVSLSALEKLRRVVVGDSWFASRATAAALKEKFGVEFTGCVKTAHASFPIEAMRWVLQSLNRGDSCVFKLENEEVWAVGWSDVHYKTYITTHGLSSEEELAQKKRQRLDGRNYRIEITRPNQSNRNKPKPYGMGGPSQLLPARHFGASRHLESQALANARANRDFWDGPCRCFPSCRNFIPKWMNCDDSESSFFRFLRELLSTNADTNEALAACQVRLKRSQTLIGKGTVQSGAKQGQEYRKQGRFHYCIKGKKKEDKEESVRFRRTAYTCSCHSNIYVCKAGLGDCWLEHLADRGDEFITSDRSGEDIDGGGDAAI